MTVCALAVRLKRVVNQVPFTACPAQAMVSLTREVSTDMFWNRPPFWAAPFSSRPGNGLGLSLVSSVASFHGGKLVLSDNGPGLKAELHLPFAAGS